MRKKIIRAIEANLHGKVARDIFNQLFYEDRHPKSDMAIYPNPQDINDVYIPTKGRVFRRRDSGRVVDGDWDLSIKPLWDNPKLESCKLRWEQGAKWEDTPIFQKLLKQIQSGQTPDGLRSREDLENRYARLDRIFEHTLQVGRLLNMHELPEYFRREHGAPLVHITRTGSCIRSGGGNHRFAIAKILSLPEFPAQLGVVHPSAIENGTFFKLLDPKMRRF